MFINAPIYAQFYGIWLLADMQMKAMHTFMQICTLAPEETAVLHSAPAPFETPQVESTPVHTPILDEPVAYHPTN